MAETKYGKYFKIEPIAQRKFASGVYIRTREVWDGINCTVGWNPILEPYLIEAAPHAHDFDQLFCFIGTNPKDPLDFGAEVELSLGEEQEKHIINKTTIVYIPKGLHHCPLYFKKVDRPVFFVNITFTSEYNRLFGPPPDTYYKTAKKV